TELSIGAFAVTFLLDRRYQVKRSFFVTYAIIYLFLSGLTYLFLQNYSTPALLNTFTLLDKAWTGYLPLPLLLFLLLMLPYTIFLWLDKKAGVDGKAKEPTGTSRLRMLHLINGSLTLLARLVTLYVLAM